ncbi:MAG: PIN domain-containing protein [Candidatus Heimdallarchaeota archaeon]|nr:PIN domain-containing protein [Candidatus Heimdallarchaeota archaeon]
MLSYVIDASVVTKWYIEEKHSHFANRIREAYILGKISLIAPSLLNYEILNALKYSNLFNASDLNVVGESLEKYGIVLYSIEGKVRERMIELAVNHDLTIYDAAYLALALENRIQLLTADTKIKRKIPKPIKETILHIKQYKEN